MRLPFDSNGHNLHEDTIEVRNWKTFETIHPQFSMCSNCGTYPELMRQDDVIIANEPCEYAQGITTVITIEVPSGKMIVDDDLRPVFDYDDTNIASYNSKLGQSQAIKAMAELGCAYGPVGNSCPSLFETTDGFVIASPDINDEDKIVNPTGKELANICTDLWAYSIADFELWKQRGGDVNSMSSYTTILNVEPGTYEFTHHTGELEFDRDAYGCIVFADVKMVNLRT